MYRVLLRPANRIKCGDTGRLGHQGETQAPGAPAEESGQYRGRPVKILSGCGGNQAVGFGIIADQP
jgi:hypothetical protein